MPDTPDFTQQAREWLMLADVRVQSTHADRLSEVLSAAYEQGRRDGLESVKGQIEVEGWTLEHDDGHENGEIADAAACYASGNRFLQVTEPNPRWRDSCANVQPRFRTLYIWPQEWEYKGGDRIRELVKAGALIAAEVDRLRRLEARTAATHPEPKE